MIGRIVTYLVLAWLLFSGGAVSPAAEPTKTTMSEAQVKVAYLYNFANFVEWPPGAFATPASPVVVCILGKSGFGDALDALTGRSVRGRKIQLREAATIDDIGHCHILFVAASEQGHLRTILADLGKQPVVTVSDIKLFAQSGGMIGLLREGGRVRFEVNLGNAERTGVKISSQLLRLATAVLR